MAGKPAENVTGVLFAAPTCRKRRCAFETHTRVTQGKPLGDCGRAIRRVVVEHDDFEVAVAVFEQGFQRGADVLFLVARGNENRTP